MFFSGLPADSKRPERITFCTQSVASTVNTLDMKLLRLILAALLLTAVGT
jgi:hypothetical protein